MRALLHTVAGFVIRRVVQVFFRRVEIAGLEGLPEGPLILCANHPNSILDPILVAYAFPERTVNFLAAAILFDRPLTGRLLTGLGIIPVHRPQDDPSKLARNTEMFRAAVDTLHAGQCLGIFPEGVTAEDPRLQPLKTGAARIALQALEEGPEELRVHLVPVGLNYRDRETFRSDVLVLFGEPIDPRPLLDGWREDPPTAGRALTEEVRAGLEAVVQNLSRLEDEEDVRRLEKLYRHELSRAGEGLEERFRLSKNIIDGIELFRREDPARVERVKAILDQYFFGIEALGLAGGQLRAEEVRYGVVPVGGFVLRVFPPLLLLLPFALLGYLGNLVPYTMTDRLALAMPGYGGRQRRAIRRVGWGACFFGIWYAVLGGTLWHHAGIEVALSTLVVLPPCGLLALWFGERLRFLWRHAQTLLVMVTGRRFRERMQGLRRELLGELSALSAAYRERRGLPAAPGFGEGAGPEASGDELAGPPSHREPPD